WEALAAIPYGETRTYAEIASAIGRPQAVRAVARACATNPVALAVPCHRVVSATGSSGGGRGGAGGEKKRTGGGRRGRRSYCRGNEEKLNHEGSKITKDTKLFCTKRLALRAFVSS